MRVGSFEFIPVTVKFSSCIEFDFNKSKGIDFSCLNEIGEPLSIKNVNPALFSI